MTRSVLLAACLAALLAPLSPLSGQSVSPPAEHLGRPLGADFELADWNEVSGYYRQLAEQSPRVLLQRLGETEEGRDYLMAIISSEENLARLDEIQAINARIADPRGLDDDEVDGLLERGRAVLFVSIAMHSTETAAPQFGMEFAHLLATSDAEPFRSAREELVVVMTPCQNPDGLDHVVSWYRETVGTPHEATSLLELYQLYAGHDNNRDWFMLSLAETRLMTEQLYSVWHPQVYWDVHQQGSSRERFFVPPFRDPLNPNLDPAIIAGIDAIGSRALLDMTREGFSGVSTGVTYDMWWNGGNRNVPVRHNIIGLLTEAASVNVASPVWLAPDMLSAPRGIDGGYVPSNRFPDPWPGGWWRLRHIIDYEHAFGRSLLGSLARERKVWLANALDAARRSIEAGREGAPRAWVLPSDNRDVSATRRLMETLILGGVEVHVAREPIQADGRAWPAGSIVIQREQPYGDHVKDLFEVQRYPDGDPPYDVAGWTLPLLLGVHRVEVMGGVQGGLERVATADEAVAGFPAAAEGTMFSPVPGDASNGDTWSTVFQRLDHGDAVFYIHSDEWAGRFAWRATEEDDEAGAAARARVAHLPRVGLYAPWSSSMDEGWTRWVLERFGVPYVRVRNEMIRAGALDDLIDVLVIPSVGGWQLDGGRRPGSVAPEYTRGLAPEGAVAIDEFVRSGGTLVTLGSSSAWAIDLFQLPLVDATRGDDAGDFSCPGSVLRAVPATDGPWTAGLPSSMALFFSRSAAWRVEGEGAEHLQTLLSYAPTRVLLSGWIRSPEVIAGHSAWVRARVGQGAVHLFGFRPQYRSWSQGTFQLLFRALTLEALEPQ